MVHHGVQIVCHSGSLFGHINWLHRPVQRVWVQTFEQKNSEPIRIANVRISCAVRLTFRNVRGKLSIVGNNLEISLRKARLRASECRILEGEEDVLWSRAGVVAAVCNVSPSRLGVHYVGHCISFHIGELGIVELRHWVIIRLVAIEGEDVLSCANGGLGLKVDELVSVEPLCCTPSAAPLDFVHWERGAPCRVQWLRFRVSSGNEEAILIEREAV